MVTRVEFRGVSKNAPFNPHTGMKHVMKQLFDTNTAVYICKHNNKKEGFSHIESFPKDELVFNAYFKVDTTPTKVIMEMTMNSYSRLQDLKKDPKMMQFLSKNRIFLINQQFETLKVRCIGWILNKSIDHTWRPSLENDTQKILESIAIDLAMEDMHNNPNNNGTMLDLDQAVPKFKILPAGINRRDRATQQLFNTAALEYVWEVTRADDLIPLLTEMNKNPEHTRITGDFIPTIPASSNNSKKYINAIRAQNDYLNDIRTIPIIGIKVFFGFNNNFGYDQQQNY